MPRSRRPVSDHAATDESQAELEQRTDESQAELEQRVARCELMMASMLIAGSGRHAPFDVREAMEAFFAARTSDADLLEFLRNVMRRRVVPRDMSDPTHAEDLFQALFSVGAQVEEIAAQSGQLAAKIGQLEDDRGQLLEKFAAQIKGLQGQLFEYRDEVLANREFERDLRSDLDVYQHSLHDLHTLLFFQSLGLEP